MAIRFACTCGRQLQAADEHAGKRSKCPACGAAHVIPSLAPAVADLEIVSDELPTAEPVDDDVQVDAPSGDRGDDEKKKRGTKKKRKKHPSREKDGPLAKMFLEQAREDMRRDDARARAAGSWSRDEDEGWTLFGVHLTAGVVSGAGMLFAGLMGMAFIALYRHEMFLGPRIFIAAIGCTVIGGITLMRAVFFGEED